MTDNCKVEKYFAAANSYRGFISYFDKLFSSNKYDKIYVLKGGPGTGKSSLMKAVENKVLDKHCNVQEIYCSSDPKSLDAVIITSQDKRIAIIDGTAPHERDAVIPGAIDEIINLADGIDKQWISGKRNDILALNKEKKNAYKAAYSYLSIAGAADKFITETYRSIFDKKRAKNKAEEILSSISCDKNEREDIKLISSFGRLGSYSLDTLELISKRLISVSGDEIASSLLIEELSNYLRYKEVSFTRLLCPKNPDALDALYIPDSSLSISRKQVGDIDAESFLTFMGYDKEQIKTANMIKRDALEEAKRWFAIASDLHFRLEDIYIASMNFDKNEEIILNITEEIENILEI